MALPVRLAAVGMRGRGIILKIIILAQVKLSATICVLDLYNAAKYNNKIVKYYDTYPVGILLQ